MANAYQNKRALVVGLGASGQSAAHFLLLNGSQVVGVDQNKELQDHPEIAKLCVRGMKFFYEGDLLDLNSFHLVVVSPGISPKHPIYQAAKQAGIEIVGEMELACRSLKQKFLAITGTNGKTTVTLLIEHVLNRSGKKVRALGNVGTPITAALCQDSSEDEIIVAELSSFQLETLNSQIIDVGVILNITPDHLDRYSSLEEYAKSKIHMQACLKPNGKLFVEEACFKKYRSLFQGDLLTYGYGTDCHLYTDLSAVFFGGRKEFTLPVALQKPSHDLENILAAYALCREMNIGADQFCSALASFKKPSHRIEYVRTHKGVSYYDDSKGTNIDAVIRAVASLPGNIILIAGGVDKGSPYAPWISSFEGKVSQICVIGEAAPKIKEELGRCFTVHLFETMEGAVKYASQAAKPNEHVLLSPGCSSYDMFKNYAHRGEEFQRIVNAL